MVFTVTVDNVEISVEWTLESEGRGQNESQQRKNLEKIKKQKHTGPASGDGQNSGLKGLLLKYSIFCVPDLLLKPMVWSLTESHQ